ncbi:MAG: hypothetical protein ACE5JX_15300 [Acidobacteriota bacterium]
MQCMSRQLTVRLPDDLNQGVRLASQELNRTPSEIVRLALRQFLNLVSGQERPARRVSDLLGSLDSGIPDLAERHREYVLESLKNGG